MTKTLRKQLDQLKDTAFHTWSIQGRTDEQKWAVGNFLTGSGGQPLTDQLIQLFTEWALEMVGEDEGEQTASDPDCPKCQANPNSRACSVCGKGYGPKPNRGTSIHLKLLRNRLKAEQRQRIEESTKEEDEAV